MNFNCGSCCSVTPAKMFLLLLSVLRPRSSPLLRLFWCCVRTARSVISTETDEGSFLACSALTSFVKYTDRNVPATAVDDLQATPFLVAVAGEGGGKSVVSSRRACSCRGLTSGCGESYRRFGELGVRCRLSHFTAPCLRLLSTSLSMTTVCNLLLSHHHCFSLVRLGVLCL